MQTCTPPEGTLVPVARTAVTAAAGPERAAPPGLPPASPSHFPLGIQGQGTLLFPYKIQHFPHIWYFVMIWSKINACSWTAYVEGQHPEMEPGQRRFSSFIILRKTRPAPGRPAPRLHACFYSDCELPFPPTSDCSVNIPGTCPQIRRFQIWVKEASGSTS